MDFTPSISGNKRLRTDNNTVKLKYAVKTNNQFEVLSDSEQEYMDEDVIPSSSKQVENTKASSKVPPIVVYGLLTKHTEALAKIKPDLTDELTIKYRGNRMLMYTKNMVDYKTLLEKLSNSEVEYHTYTPKSEAEPRMVLKSIPPNVTAEEIESDLVSKKLKTKSIVQMIKKDNDNTQIKLPLYIVTFDKSVNISDIVKNSKICNCIIQWEKFKNVKGVTQCFKCQQFGHIAKNCFREPKCMKCAQSHNSKDCPVIHTEIVKCVNCAGNHMANDKTCAIFNKVLNKRSTPTSSNNTKIQASYRIKQSEFPSLPHQSSSASTPATEETVWNKNRPKSTNQQTTGNQSIGDLFKEIKCLFSALNVTKIVSTINCLSNKLKQAPDAITKFSLIIESVVDLFD